MQAEHEHFKDRLAQVIGDESAASFARKCGLSSGAVRKYLKGTAYPTLDNLIGIAAAGDVTVGWLAANEGAMHATGLVREPSVRYPQQSEKLIQPEGTDELSTIRHTSKLPTISIPIFVNALDAGGGNHVEAESELVEYGDVLESWLRKEVHVNPARAFLARVWGDSMSPLIDEGDFVLGERTQEVASEGIYALVYNSMLLVKHLTQGTKGQLLLVSENSRYPTKEVDLEYDTLYIIGRVLRRVTRLY